MEKIIFISIAVVWGICFLRMPLISWKAIKFVKRKYPREWQNKFQHRIGTSIFGGRTVFQLLSTVNDPVVNNLKKKWNAALCHFFLLVLFSFILVVAYILVVENY